MFCNVYCTFLFIFNEFTEKAKGYVKGNVFTVELAEYVTLLYKRDKRASMLSVEPKSKPIKMMSKCSGKGRGISLGEKVENCLKLLFLARGKKL